MFKDKDIEEKEKYIQLFKDKFGEKKDLDDKKQCSEFYTEYIKEIEKKYRNIALKKSSDYDTDYLRREKILVETNIKSLEKHDFSYTSFTTIISSVLVVMVFGIGRMVDYFSTNFKFHADDALKNKLSQQIVKQVENSIDVYFTDMAKLILVFTAGTIVIIAITITLIDIWTDRKRRNCNRKTAFNRMCLGVLNKISEN